MPTVWVLGEVVDGDLKRVSLEAAGVARSLAAGGAVTGVVIGHGAADAARELGTVTDFVLHLDGPELDTFSPDGAARAIASVAAGRRPDIIVGGATFRGRDMATRVAAELGVDIAQDVVDCHLDGDRVVASRPVFAGKAVATVELHHSPQILTIRPNSVPAPEATSAGTVETLALDGYHAGAIVTGWTTSASSRPDVAEADVIVSGGRGLGGPEHFHLIEGLADALGAAVGASRAVVDAGWRPHSEQVGQTGKTVSPSLYVACGISGAVQHLAGMKTAKVIVAINKDADAPIFSVADYGIVGDVFEVIPAVTRAVNELASH
jgi:electron transfer flavoprotein alpha subunit